MEQKNMNPHFLSIVMVFAGSCWQHLGKVPNQITGKIEKDLAQAQMAIDILDMLSQKTKGNLTSEEDKFLLSTLSDLQLNYADEVDKEAKTPQPQVKEEQKTETKQTDPEVKK
ncbi:MAG: DUF1844 domain-containing protein [Elusimicrobia bacterium]|nr:DUF1844 domain-containing protein [Candidatus Liberimonas magnetica]